MNATRPALGTFILFLAAVVPAFAQFDIRNPRLPDASHASVEVAVRTEAIYGAESGAEVGWLLGPSAAVSSSDGVILYLTRGPPTSRNIALMGRIGTLLEIPEMGRAK